MVSLFSSCMDFRMPGLDGKLKLVTFEGATHWVLRDESEAVSQHIVEYFLSDYT